MRCYSATKFIILLPVIFYIQIKSADSQSLPVCLDTCSAPGPELVINGDFNQAVPNSPYTTSVPFAFAAWTTNMMMNIGQYRITTDAALHNNQWSGFDHTTGSGNFLVCDGLAGSQTSIWGQDVNISAYAPNTDFVFTAWVNNNVWPIGNYIDPIYQLRAGGVLLLPAAVTVTELPDIWIQLTATWNSGPAPPASITIEVVTTSTAGGGNDCGVDDISFRACLPASSVTVSAGTDQTICVGDSVQLNAVSNVGTFSWSPAAGLSATNIPNPVASPAVTTTYIVTAGSGLTCANSDTIVVFVTQTIADTTFNYTLSQCGQTATFQSNGATGVTYTWDFGDGNSSNLPNPVHSFSNTGTYTVTLIATDACGSDTVIQQINITVISAVIAQFSYTQSPCTLDIQFQNQSTNATSYTWSFGDGNSGNSTSPVHTYTSAGNYTVNLIAFDSCGSDTSTIVISLVAPVITQSQFTWQYDTCSQTITLINQSINGNNYTWLFGDGSSGTTTNPVHIFTNAGTYNISLISTGNCNTDTLTIPFTVIPVTAPVAAFNYSSSVCGDSVTFINNSAQAISLQWNFGDGTGSALPDPMHVYNTPGTYSVTLVAAGLCTTDTAVSVITIPDNALQPSFTYLQDSCSNEVSFEITCSNCTAYFWDFGDGISSTTASPDHLYNAPGSYMVTFTASNSCTTQNISGTVTAGALFPANADFIITYDSCSLTISYQNNSVNAFSQSWDFGDGNNSSAESGNHTYSEPGEYLLTLLINENAGCRVEIDTLLLLDNSNNNIFIPNVFTPNGDGKNDLFSIVSSYNCVEGKIKLFNRWGILIFESDNLHQSWDGTSSGTKAPEGIYVYLVEVNGNTRKGFVHLIR